MSKVRIKLYDDGDDYGDDHEHLCIELKVHEDPRIRPYFSIGVQSTKHHKWNRDEDGFGTDPEAGISIPLERMDQFIAALQNLKARMGNPPSSST